MAIFILGLVGTRPPTEDEFEQYELHHKARLGIRPGLTGMWQVSGRSDIKNFEEIVFSRLFVNHIMIFLFKRGQCILIGTVVHNIYFFRERRRGIFLDGRHRISHILFIVSYHAGYEL